jgi:hypothetical protein
MNTARDILLKILTATDYSDNREARTDEFLRNIHLQSLVNLVQFLPSEKQREIKQQLSENTNSPEKLASLLKDYFSQRELHQVLENAAKDAVTQIL